MSLPVPVVGTDPGPDYAYDLNTCLSLIDSHDHSSGSGVQVTPSGININSDLGFGGNNLTTLRSVRMSVQSAALNGASDLGCLYVTGVDLYYNDESGNQIRITASGAVSGTPGSISGLASPASASYNSGTGTFIFQSAANTAGNLDGGSVKIRETAAAANAVTLSSPTSLASNYTLTFPGALPGSQKFATVDASGNIAAPWAVDGSTLEIASSTTLQVKSSGITATQLASNSVTTAKISDSNVTTAKIADQNITQSKLAARASGTTVAAGGVALSTSSGSFSSGTTSIASVTNLSVTITTTGRPVQLLIQPDGGASTASYFLFDQGNVSGSAFVYFFNGSTEISKSEIRTNNTATIVLRIPGTLSMLDMSTNGAASTYTYSVKVSVGDTAQLIGVNNLVLVAYEI